MTDGGFIFFSYFPEYLSDSIGRSVGSLKSFSVEELLLRRDRFISARVFTLFDTEEDRSWKGHDYRLIYYVKLSFLSFFFLSLSLSLSLACLVS